MNKWYVAGAVGAFAILLTRASMKYFVESEFNGYYSTLSNDLKRKLDKFRAKWGEPVNISQAPGAVGRYDDSNSQHNINKWGETRAIDVFPTKNGQRLTDIEDVQRAVNIAIDVGFTGIGVYTDTYNGAMLHLDVRDGDLATWGRINGEYVGIDSAIDDVKEAYA